MRIGNIWLMIDKHRRLLLFGSVVLVAVFIALIATTPSTHAIPNKMVMNFYYSDPDFTNQVGWQTVLRCFGTSGPLHGEMGEYVRQEETICVDPSPTNPTRCYFIIYDENTGVIYHYHSLPSSYCT